MASPSSSINPLWISSTHSYSRALFSRRFRRVSLTPRIRINRLLVVKYCSSECDQNQNNGGSFDFELKDTLSGILEQQMEELLKREENRELLDGLDKASQRVEKAKRDLAEIQRQELAVKQFKGYIDHLQARASKIAECQREILEAKAMVEEAENYLRANSDGLEISNTFVGREREEIWRDRERWESIKAASVSALVGTLAGLPISFTQVSSSSQLILPLAINFISCALFGVTFRYTIRRNLDDAQLKTGISAAFGFVKGLGMLSVGPPLELNSASFLSHALDGAIYVSENLLIFIFAAVGLDYCFKMRLLSPFPVNRAVSDADSK